MKNILFFFLLVFVILALSACDSGQNQGEFKPDEKKIKKFIQEKNKENVGIEDQQIDDYLKRRKWTFQRTKTGIRYHFYQRGQGMNPKPNQRVELHYELSLIRGEKVYSSKDEGPLRFVVDHEDVPAGLNEFVQLMKPGDKAMLIVPSYQGYGVAGDGNKVPARATLIYDLELIRVFN